MHYVHILCLSNSQFYTGLADNLKRRFKEHQGGKVDSTKNRQPLELVFYESFLSKEDAKRREKYLKTSKGKSTLKMMLRDYLKNQ